VAASIDVGATSVHLLVGTVDGHRVAPLLDESEFLGLGDRLAAEGYLGDELRAALIAVLDRYVSRARDLGATTVTIVGTDPIRRTGDAPAVVREVESRLGVPLHVLDHAEEGLLTLIGATGGRPVNGELLLVDIGGGSSEFVTVGLDGHAHALGLPLGAARLTRDLVRSDPPSLAEIEALRREVARVIVDAPEASPSEIVAVGGTASNLLRLLPATAVDRSLTRRRIAVALAMLTVERSGEAAMRHLIRPERARILPAGAIIVDAVLERYRADRLRVSEAGIREGAILAALHGGASWRDRLTPLALGWSDPRATD
jgi:exopolyphosphatase/guanosine-5'-triphosphate,3'-diphosphate pyrophosphatase